jgi:hypothetical protein
MAAQVAHLLGMAAGWLVAALAALGPRAGLLLGAGLATGVVLLIFRRTADQRALRGAKDRMQAALLGLVLFRHDTSVMFHEEGRLIFGALGYLRAGLRPLAFIVIPMVVLVAEMDLAYGRRALAPGESVILTVEFADGRTNGPPTAEVIAGPGLQIETPALRIAREREVCWRIAAETAGSHAVTVRIGDQAYRKSVVVGPHGGRRRVSPTRARAAWAVLLETAEPPLPADSPLKRISIDYPRATVALGAWHLHWLVPFLAAAMVWGLVLKGPLRVEL